MSDMVSHVVENVCLFNLLAMAYRNIPDVFFFFQYKKHKLHICITMFAYDHLADDFENN